MIAFCHSRISGNDKYGAFSFPYSFSNLVMSSFSLVIEISEVIRAYYKVYNTLGYGFLEKVYENALANELKQRGVPVVQQAPIKVYYDTQLVGECYADLLVVGKVIVDLKVVVWKLW